MSYEPEKNKEYLNSRYADQQKEFIAYLGGKCYKCGTDSNLEIDHIDWRLKSFSVSKLWAKKQLPKAYAELDKCQLLCTSCHKEKTKVDLSEQFTKEPVHGTIYSWMKRKCDCEICEIAKREWYDKRNAKRRAAGGPRGPYNQPAEHGTYKRYTRGCKCTDCRQANANHAKMLRDKKKIT